MEIKTKPSGLNDIFVFSILKKNRMQTETKKIYRLNDIFCYWNNKIYRLNDIFNFPFQTVEWKSKQKLCRSNDIFIFPF